MPRLISPRLLPLFSLLLSAGSLHAVEIKAVGADLSTKDAWRTPTPAARKPLDGDGDYLYGTDGFLMFHTGYTGAAHSLKPNVFAGASRSLPDYVSVLAAGASASLGAANFARIDNPADPSVDMLSGVALIAGLAIGGEASMFKLVFKNPPLKGVRIGVMTNNAVNRNPGAIRLQSDSDSTASASHPTAVGIAGQACYFFFDVTNLSDGDSLTLFVTEDTLDKNENGEARIGGFTFDRLR